MTIRARVAILLLGPLALGGCQTEGGGWQDAARAVMDAPIFSGADGTARASLGAEQIMAGLKEALTVSSGIVTTQLSKNGGFNLDPKIRIPLPPALQKADSALKSVGMAHLTEDLQSRMNGAAERAAGEALPLFLAAIRDMTIADARGILSGPPDAATQYLRAHMGPALSQKIQPIVEAALIHAGAVQAYDRVMGQYARLPFMPDVKANLNNFVTQKAMDGIFYYIAQEEAAIRENPAKRTSELLRIVFRNT